MPISLSIIETEYVKLDNDMYQLKYHKKRRYHINDNSNNFLTPFWGGISNFVIDFMHGLYNSADLTAHNGFLSVTKCKLAGGRFDNYLMVKLLTSQSSYAMNAGDIIESQVPALVSDVISSRVFQMPVCVQRGQTLMKVAYPHFGVQLLDTFLHLPASLDRLLKDMTYDKDAELIKNYSAEKKAKLMKVRRQTHKGSIHNRTVQSGRHIPVQGTCVPFPVARHR